MNVTDTSTSATPYASAAAAPGSTNDPSKKTGGLGALSDVNSFLTLLVKQLQNQDPLSPQDGAQFAAQLAQFSSLDQLVGINSRLTQLIDAASAPTTTSGSAAKVSSDIAAQSAQVITGK